MITAIFIILIVVISFILFLILRGKFTGSTATAVKQAWAGLHFAIGVPLFLMRLPSWMKGDFKDITLLIVAVPYTVTGIIMFIFSIKDREVYLNDQKKTNMHSDRSG